MVSLPPHGLVQQNSCAVANIITCKYASNHATWHVLYQDHHQHGLAVYTCDREMSMRHVYLTCNVWVSNQCIVLHLKKRWENKRHTCDIIFQSGIYVLCSLSRQFVIGVAGTVLYACGHECGRPVVVSCRSCPVCSHMSYTAPQDTELRSRGRY